MCCSIPVRREQQDLAALDPEGNAMRAVRGGRIGLIFQEPMTALSVHYTVGNQIIEAMRAHSDISKAAARERVVALLHEVGIPRPETRIDAYPFQLSGGLRQRVGIALALAADPQILIADEPTTALDVTTQAQILALLRRLQRTKGVALMLITHDMGVIAQMADDVAVMYLGRIVEFAPVAQLFAAPRHPYTRALLRSVPNLRAVPRERLATIGGAVPHPGARPVGCPFHPRCPEMIEGRCDRRRRRKSRPASGRELLPRGRDGHACEPHERDAARMCSRWNLSKEFPIQQRAAAARDRPGARGAGCELFDRPRRDAGAGRRERLRQDHRRRAASCARCRRPEGAIRFSPRAGSSIDMAPLSRRALRPLRRHIQMIFQDPYASLNPRMMVGDIIAEPLLVNGVPAAQRQARVRELLDLVGLPAASHARAFRTPSAAASASASALPARWRSIRRWWSPTSRSPRSTSPCRPRSSTCCSTCRTGSACRCCSSPTISAWCAMSATAWP